MVAPAVARPPLGCTGRHTLGWDALMAHIGLYSGHDLMHRTKSQLLAGRPGKWVNGSLPEQSEAIDSLKN